MKIALKIFLICLISLASDCDVPFSYIDDSRLIVEGTLRLSNGDIAANKTVNLQSDSFILNQTVSDNNGKFYITSPKANKKIYWYCPEYKIGVVQQYPSFSNAAAISDFSKSYYDLGTIELIPVN